MLRSCKDWDNNRLGRFDSSFLNVKHLLKGQVALFLLLQLPHLMHKPLPKVFLFQGVITLKQEPLALHLLQLIKDITEGEVCTLVLISVLSTHLSVFKLNGSLEVDAFVFKKFIRRDLEDVNFNIFFTLIHLHCALGGSTHDIVLDKGLVSA